MPYLACEQMRAARLARADGGAFGYAFALGSTLKVATSDIADVVRIVGAGSDGAEVA